MRASEVNSVGEGLLPRKHHIIVLMAQQNETLKKLHDGHQGMVRFHLRARLAVWWLSLFKQLTNLIRTCPECTRGYRIAELSREKTFSFFAVSEPSVKVFSAKFCNPQCARSVYAGVLRMREGHTYIIIGLKQSAKVFSAKFSFCTETRKFSPSKVFRYTVFLSHSEQGGNGMGFKMVQQLLSR